jgi:hypothetical protein
MANKITKSFTKIWIVLILAAATALTVPAQYPPGVKRILAGGAEQTLTGVIRIPKEFGMVPHAAGSDVASRYPCEEFYVAALDPDNKNRLITV